MIRSLLFAPADSATKLGKAVASAADTVICDLEDSVAPANKEAGRTTLAEFLRSASADKPIFVRVNALDTGETLNDLAAVMPFAPFGIVLPKCRNGADVQTLGHYLAAFEAAHALTTETKILGIATETASSIFGLGAYTADPRLWGLMWGGEDLMADIGALDNRDTTGTWSGPFALARSLCLFAAAKAGVVAVDTVTAKLDDPTGLERECTDARRDGFQAKAAIHPKQLEAINRLFQASEESLVWAKRVLEAVATAGGGVAKLDGKMLDAPHVRSAKRILGTGK